MEMGRWFLMAAAVTTLFSASCRAMHRDAICSAGVALSISEVRTVVERFDWQIATVKLRVDGHGAGGTQACLGYPWEIRGEQHDANEAQLVIGSHGPCATDALDASNGASSDVSVQVMTNGLMAGMFRLWFPVLVISGRSATRCGEATSPEFFLEIASRPRETP